MPISPLPKREIIQGFSACSAFSKISFARLRSYSHSGEANVGLAICRYTFLSPFKTNPLIFQILN